MIVDRVLAFAANYNNLDSKARPVSLYNVRFATSPPHLLTHAVTFTPPLPPLLR